MSDFNSKKYTSIRAAAKANKVPEATLRSRLSGRKSRSISHQQQQHLSDVEEGVLCSWITQLTCTGFSPTPALVTEMAVEIQQGRKQFLNQPSPGDLIGRNWTLRFQKRHPHVKGMFSRALDSARFKNLDATLLNAYFDAVVKQHHQYNYLPQHIYNADETGFRMGDSQSSRVLVDSRVMNTFQRAAEKQEWITVFECTSAAGHAIDPLVVFKAHSVNSGWLPVNVPPSWSFSASDSGWTSNVLGYEWLTRVFEPATRPADPATRRLLFMDGHSSHLTAKVIHHCMEHTIDLLILPPHTSQITQPMDVGVFGPLKSYMSKETSHRHSLATSRMTKAEWMEMYLRAREKALTSRNIRAGWHATGLWPLAREKLLEKVPAQPMPPTKMNMQILGSSPPSGTNTQGASKLLTSWWLGFKRQPHAVQPKKRQLTSSRSCSIPASSIPKARESN